MHARISYDDLSAAVAIVRVSLLLRRPPGRDTYRGDVFYLHSACSTRRCKASNETMAASLTGIAVNRKPRPTTCRLYSTQREISITDVSDLPLKRGIFFQVSARRERRSVSVARVGSAPRFKANGSRLPVRSKAKLRAVPRMAHFAPVRLRPLMRDASVLLNRGARGNFGGGEPF